MKRERSDDVVVVKVYNRNLFIEYVCRNGDENDITKFIEYAEDLGYVDKNQLQGKLTTENLDRLCTAWTIKTHTSPDEENVFVKTRTDTFEVPLSLILLSNTFKNYLDDTNESILYLEKTPIDAETFRRLIPLLEITYALRYKMGPPNSLLKRLHEIVSFHSGDIVKLFYAINYLDIPFLYNLIVATIQKLLVQLIRVKNVAGFRYIMDNVIGPIDPSFAKNALLNAAAKEGVLEVVEYLIYKKQVFSSEDFARSPFGWSINNNDYEIMVALFPFVEPQLTADAALVAAKQGYAKILKFLLENGATKKSQNLERLASEAIKFNHIDALKVVIKYINDRDSLDKLLAMAFNQNSRAEIVEILLKMAKPSFDSLFRLFTNIKNPNRNVALISTQYLISKLNDKYVKREVENIKYLLHIAAKFGLTQEFRNLMWMVKYDHPLSSAQICALGKIAASNGHWDIIESIFSQKPVIGCETDMLIKAAGAGHALVVKNLIKKGVDPSYDNNYAFQIALKNYHVDTIEALLLSNKLKPITMKEIESIFHATIVNNQIELTKRLLSSYLELSVGTLRAILQSAANFKRTEIIKELLKNPELRNDLRTMEKKIRRDLQKGIPIERKVYKPWEITVAKVLRDMILMNQ